MTTTTDLSNITGTWTIDATHTTIGFTARHAMIAKVHGRFAEFEGSLVLDGATPANSSTTLTIQAASINTGNADRDGHLISADFLDAEQFPTVTFASTSVTHSGGNDFVLAGDLTVHGVTKPVEIKVELSGVGSDPWGNTRIGLEGSTEVSRKDYGLTWNAAIEGGGILVSDHIKITLDVQAIKQV